MPKFNFRLKPFLNQVLAPVLSFAFLSGTALPQAHAWRETGHFAVCEIAMRHLTPQAKAQVNALMNGADFATSCTWPDQVRKTPEWEHTYPWHFVSINDNSPYLPNLDIKGDAVQALIFAEDQLRKPSVPPADKTTALKFLGHFSGDVHQPLHVGRVHDSGGNTQKVEWFGQTEHRSVEILITGPVEVNDKISLHKVWDLHMINKFLELNKITDGSEYNHKAYASALDRISKADMYYWGKATYLDWAYESYRDRDAAYSAPSKLGMEYYKKNIGLLNTRIVQAGHRLAATLNRIYGTDALSKRELEMRQLLARARAQKNAANDTVTLSLIKREREFEKSGLLMVLCEALSAPSAQARPSNLKSYLERFQKSQGRPFSAAECRK